MLFLLWLLLPAACASPTSPRLASASVVEAIGGPTDEAFARAYTPMDFAFPRDHGPHPEYRTEWWYYTGNLTGEEGGEYGYQLTFFRSALSAEAVERTSGFATNQIYMAHFAVTSGPTNEHRSFDRFSRGAGGLAGATGDPQYTVWLEDWRAEQIGPEQYRLQAETTGPDGAVAIDLVMEETREPLLHGDRGLSQKGTEPGNANYYYSLVRMATTGTVTFDGETTAIDGLSWMDHEFGTSSLSGDVTGWDWFAVQLENGAALMFGEFHNAAGTNRRVYEGTLAYPSGEQVTLGSGSFELIATDTWTSPVTGNTYPFGWRVAFPAHDIELIVEPLIQDQEMEVAFQYYEGATRVEGTFEGEPVQGRGYVELTGYGDAAGRYQR